MIIIRYKVICEYRPGVFRKWSECSYHLFTLLATVALQIALGLVSTSQPLPLWMSCMHALFMWVAVIKSVHTHRAGASKFWAMWLLSSSLLYTVNPVLFAVKMLSFLLKCEIFLREIILCWIIWYMKFIFWYIVMSHLMVVYSVIVPIDPLIVGN